MKLDKLQKLYINELRDLYNAENQLLKALPKMAKAASSPELKQAFEKHLKQTKSHVERLEEVFKDINEKPKGKTCHGMKGLIEEGSEILQEEGDESVIDAGIIVAAQKVEHYEIAGYGSVRTFADLLGKERSAELLQTTRVSPAVQDSRAANREIARNRNANASSANARSRAAAVVVNPVAANKAAVSKADDKADCPRINGRRKRSFVACYASPT